MDAGDRYYLNKDIENLQFKVKTLREDYGTLENRLKAIKALKIDVEDVDDKIESLADLVFGQIGTLEADIALNSKLGKLASEDRINNRLKALEDSVNDLKNKKKEE